MVLHKHGEMLYNGVNRLVAEHLDRLAKDEIIPAFPAGGSVDPTNQSQEGEILLKALRRVWDDHTGSMTKLGQILKYMVRSSLITFGISSLRSFFNYRGPRLHEIGGRS
jgi:cullin 3